MEPRGTPALTFFHVQNCPWIPQAMKTRIQKSYNGGKCDGNCVQEV